MKNDNPFSATRAVDFSDSEIAHRWIELPGGGGGAIELGKLRSEMPMIVLGGKGSGKTHLFRFLSTAVRRASGQSSAQIIESNFLGIYLRCGGINAARFDGKGRGTDYWSTVFHHYMDLTLAQLMIGEIFALVPDDPQREASVCSSIVSLFDEWSGPRPDTLRGLRSATEAMRRMIDLAVNNYSLSGTLDVRITATPTKLVFGIPAALVKHYSELAALRFVYLIDELENLSEYQQVYVNSLIRENSPPCSIKVGAKLYGHKTFATLSAGEDLKEGSEYEALYLDDLHRSKGSAAARTFAARLCFQRLLDAGKAEELPRSKVAPWMTSQFESDKLSKFGDSETAFADSDSDQRPWVARLRRYLQTSGLTEAQRQQVVAELSLPQHPLVERVALHVFYQAWYNSGPTVAAARTVRRDVELYLRGEITDFAQSFAHWKVDMLASVQRDYKRYAIPAGFDSLVQMSYGLPRHFLVILKHTYSWSGYRGERPYEGGIVSAEAQRLGVRDAADWFFQDASLAGQDGNDIQQVVMRLIELCRSVRFADKPSEVGLCAISTSWQSLDQRARRLLSVAARWSLVAFGRNGRLERNSRAVNVKIRLNPLLAARWGLSPSLRGDIRLTKEQVSCLTSGSDPEFASMVKELVAPMNGPTFDRRRPVRSGGTPQRLPGF